MDQDVHPWTPRTTRRLAWKLDACNDPEVARPRVRRHPDGGLFCGRIGGLDSVVRSRVHHEVMRTSEPASRVGVNTETLRYYERRGLLAEPARTSGGYRDYPPTAVALLRFIKRAQELGFRLDEVEELLQLDAGGPDSCEAARALAERRIDDLAARIRDLQRMRDSLTDLVATCDQPRADRSCVLLEAIDHHSEVTR